MTAAVHLTHVDPARNMARFYTLTIQPTLFGEWSLVREWGRIGQAGQVKATPYPSSAEAESALQRFQRQKERRGYASLHAMQQVRKGSICDYALRASHIADNLPL